MSIHVKGFNMRAFAGQFFCFKNISTFTTQAVWRSHGSPFCVLRVDKRLLDRFISGAPENI
jgi:hypothetical protein